ncbi:U11/U12 small nuclear ribonucleoprotein 25 kDa protein [Anabrus simplex]|uniref:U11/U12 small nuclear ribonucleoprotein 25 kDa protein n=1 Tax=Anabrus simplex TaxID=316456 RepID=UPI0034DCD7F9
MANEVQVRENTMLTSHSDDGETDSEHEVLSHEELLEITTSTLNDILSRDPVLSDLPKGVTVEEVNSQIALEHGQSITVFIERLDGERIPVVIPQKEATVLDLKRAFRRHMTLKLARERCSAKISWRYVWRSNYFLFEGQKLKNNKDLLTGYGIRNKSKVTFIKRLREKGAE